MHISWNAEVTTTGILWLSAGRTNVWSIRAPGSGEAFGARRGGDISSPLPLDLMRNAVRASGGLENIACSQQPLPGTAKAACTQTQHKARSKKRRGERDQMCMRNTRNGSGVSLGEQCTLEKKVLIGLSISVAT